MQADANPIQSCLSEENIGMSRAVMEAVATGTVVSALDVKRFVSCTLLAATSDWGVSIIAHAQHKPYMRHHVLFTACKLSGYC